MSNSLLLTYKYFLYKNKSIDEHVNKSWLAYAIKALLWIQYKNQNELASFMNWHLENSKLTTLPFSLTKFDNLITKNFYFYPLYLEITSSWNFNS